MTIDLNNPELVALVHKVSRSVSSNFPSYISHEDTEQDIWLWVLRNKNTVSKLMRDEESWQAMLYSTMAKVAAESTIKEDAAINGYSTDDMFEYSTKVVKHLLESVFDYEDWQPSPSMGDGMPKSRGQANETGDRVAMLADVNRAVLGLDDDQYNLIIWHYKYHRQVPELAGILEVTENAARLRLKRAVEAVRRSLGRKPLTDLQNGYSSRYRAVLGNAQAGYITERDYEG